MYILRVETPALSMDPEPEDRGKRLAPPAAKQTDKQRAGRTDRKLGQRPSRPCGPQMVKVNVLERDRGQTRAGLTRRRTWLCVSETLGLPMTRTEAWRRRVALPWQVSSLLTTSPGDGVRKQVQRPPREAWKDTPLWESRVWDPRAPQVHRFTCGATPRSSPTGILA